VVPTTNNRRWRDRSPEEVVEEIIYLRDRFQVRDFQIEDLNPSVHEKRWDKICHLLIEKEAGIRFYLVSGTKAETLKVEKVDLYAKAGCRFISISPESGSPQLMYIIGKRFNYNHGLKLIEACKCAGISTQACLIVGHPQETEQDHQQSCQYLEKLLLKGLDEVGIFIISPIAGSQIYKKQQIPIDSKKLLSFSPKGRDNWDVLKKRRKELLFLFFKNKLLQGSPLWIQGVRALLGRPKTKMENLPLRVLFIYWLILSTKLKNRFSQK